MKNIEDSSFLRGVEGRLDSLFGVENEKKDIVKETPEKNDDEKLSMEKVEVNVQPTPSAALKEDEGNEQSKFISEIEKRFNAIFGEDNKETKPETKPKDLPTLEEIISKAEQDDSKSIDKPTPDQPTLEEIILKAEQNDNKNINQSISDQPTLEEIIFKAGSVDSKSLDQMPSALESSNSLMSSPLKDIKSIILSLEWEIDNKILDEFDAEIIKLQKLNDGNYTILGFLLILRFLGRYIRVRGTDSNRGSITLLLSVYDNLEDVMLSEDMTDASKRTILLEDIKNYREWVDQLDFGASKDKFIEKQKMPVIPEKREPLPKWIQEDGASVMQEQKNATKIKESDEAVKKGHEINYHVPDVISAIKHMTPHEAIAYALEDIKKAMGVEINNLRSEIKRYNQPK